MDFFPADFEDRFAEYADDNRVFKNDVLIRRYLRFQSVQICGELIKNTMKHIFECIDAHTCGNPVRLVKEGGPVLHGNNMSEKRQHFLREYDWIRTGLMFEPRGHDMMSGSILYPPHDPANDVAVLFIETSGCLPMCGHGTIGAITIAIEEGLIKPKKPGVVRISVAEPNCLATSASF